MQIKTFCHFGNCGDVIASLPSLRQYYRMSGIKPILYLVKDHPAIYYDGAVHPIKDNNGNNVGLNEDMIKMVSPLLKQQEYIEDVIVIDAREVEDSDIQINLSVIRDTFCNIPNGDIRRWYWYVYPDLACDLSEQYLHIEDYETLYKNKIVISRSERYTNERIDYSFLKPYEDECIFIGTMREYNNFCMTFNLNIRKVSVVDFLEYAQILKHSKFHISNQTMAFQISEGLKIPRVVELCSYAPNVIPIGEKAFDFYSQDSLEYYFHLLNGTLEQHFKKLKSLQKEG